MSDTTAPPLPAGAATEAGIDNLQTSLGWQSATPWDGVAAKAPAISVLKDMALTLRAILAVLQQGQQNQQNQQNQTQDPPPAGPTASPDGTVVNTVGPVITTADGTQWSLTAGGQVAVNGVADTTTEAVVQIVLKNGNLYQQSQPGDWWFKTVPADTWKDASSPFPARANDFLNTVGLNILANWTGYNTPAQHVAVAKHFGARVIRTSWYQPGVNSDTLDALKAIGCKFIILLTVSNADPQQLGQIPGRIQATMNALGDSILAWEGPNECNMENKGVLDSLGRNCLDSDGTGNNGIVAQQIMIDLRNARDSVPGASKFPLMAPALWVGDSRSNTQNYLAKMNLDGICDLGNWHAYTNINGFMDQPGSGPNGVADAKTDAQRAVPGKGFCITEFGPTMLGQSYEQAAPEAGGKMEMNYYVDGFRAGAVAMTGFEAFDVTQEGFGLYNPDGSVRQLSATYMHNLTTILNDPGADAATFTPAPLSVTVPSGVNYFVLARSDGGYDILTWNEPAVADGQGHNVTPAATQVPIQLDKARSVSIFDPTQGINPTSTASGQSAQVALAGYPMIVRVK